VRVVISIVDYDQRWPSRFGVVSKRLRTALGGTALRIDHIGSTAVPALAAKDIIDVMVTVVDLDESALRVAVVSTGLVWNTTIVSDHCPPGQDLQPSDLEKRYAKMSGVNCHFRVSGRYNQRYALLCRDYLRTHPTVSAAYATIKRELAAIVVDADAYYAVKDPVFDLIMAGASPWARATGWEQGRSDA